MNNVHKMGHFRSTKLWNTLKLNYFWHGMKADVEEFCNICKTCETVAKTARQFILEHVIATEPFEILSMDLVELQTGKYLHLLTMMDVYSRFGFAVPVKNKTAEVVMKKYLNSMVVLFGIPLKILTDRGKEFLATLAIKVYKSLGIQKLSTTSYSPQGNPVERMHRELKSMLIKYITETGNNWIKGLPYALMAYNQAYHSSIGMTPFEALFSRPPRVPERFFCYYTPNTDLNMIDEMESNFKTARKHLQIQHERNENAPRFANAKATFFNPGDIVLLDFGKKARNKKLAIYDKGDFIVQSRIGPNTYRIMSQENRQFHPIVHLDKLKLKTSNIPNPRMAELKLIQTESDSEEETEQKVEIEKKSEQAEPKLNSNTGNDKKPTTKSQHGSQWFLLQLLRELQRCLQI